MQKENEEEVFTKMLIHILHSILTAKKAPKGHRNRITMFPLFLCISLLISYSPVINTPTADASSLKISASDITITKNEDYQLSISGTKDKIKWSSSNYSIAYVDNKGLVTGRKTGSSTITAKIGKSKLTCIVRVENPKISHKSIVLNTEGTFQLKLYNTRQKVSWSSNNTKIAIVDKAGYVRSLYTSGIAIITAKVGNTSYQCKVTVEQPQLSRSSVTLLMDATTEIKVYGTNQNILWESDNPLIASISDGIITAHSVGTAQITATVDKTKLTCDVTVSISEQQVRNAISSLRYVYKKYRYWNHVGLNITGNDSSTDWVTDNPCQDHTKYSTCNSYYSSCMDVLAYRDMGYALKFSDMIFGKYAPTYTFIDYSALKVGDYIRCEEHSMIVISKDAYSVTVTEVNLEDRCEISWDRTVTKGYLEAFHADFMTRY